MLNRVPGGKERLYYVATLYVLTFCLLLVMGQSYRQAKDIRGLKQNLKQTRDDAQRDLNSVNQMQDNEIRMRENLGGRVAQQAEEIERVRFYIYWLENRMMLHIVKGTPEIGRASCRERV